MAPEFLVDETKLNQSHLGKLGSHRHIIDGFFSYVLKSYGVECSTDRGSDEGRYFMFLQSDMTKVEVYSDYFGSFNEL